MPTSARSNANSQWVVNFSGDLQCCFVYICLHFSLALYANPSMLTLASDTSNINQVQQLVDQLTRRYRLDQEKHDNLLISLTEAVTNAIVHGNKQDRSKLVRIHCNQVSEGIAILVSDQGCGFNFDSLPDPTSPERICECGGRGVFLMHQLCDRMRYIDGGSTVEMRFRL